MQTVRRDTGQRRPIEMAFTITPDLHNLTFLFDLIAPNLNQELKR